jgi:hypothetical protein
MVLRGIFGPERERETERKMQEAGRQIVHNLYSSPNIIRAIKSRRMRWDFGGLGTDGRIIKGDLR